MYSGLYVTADELGFEGERKLQTSTGEDPVPPPEENSVGSPKVVDESMESDLIHIYRMGYVEYDKDKADKCYDR